MTQGRLASILGRRWRPNNQGGDKDSYSRFEWRWVDLRLDFQRVDRLSTLAI